MGSSENVAELPRWAAELLDRSRVARLGLLDDRDTPRVLPVVYAVCGDHLVTAVDQKPKRRVGAELARVRWLRTRPRAALTVDHYDDDWSNLEWVQALGSVELREAGDAAAELAALRDRYPQYREAPPAGPVIVLVPDRLLWWRSLEA
jgi:PPOX class probable F420-dependent enzyme